MTGPEDQLDPSAYALVTDDQVPAWLRPVIRRSLDGPLPACSTGPPDGARPAIGSRPC